MIREMCMPQSMYLWIARGARKVSWEIKARVFCRPQS